MFYEGMIIFIIEILGTIAFAISGAMVAIDRKMDIFGVCTLAVTTAVGGGMIRDISLNMIPSSLLMPVYIEVSIFTALIVFIVVYFIKIESKVRYKKIYENIIMAMDSVGLGLFTAVGVTRGIENGHAESTLLLVFLGTVTGVGGGLLRDVMAGVRPYILTQDIYACASIIGAFSYIWAYRAFGEAVALTCSIAIVVAIRYMARYYEWNLPSIELEL